MCLLDGFFVTLRFSSSFPPQPTHQWLSCGEEGQHMIAINRSTYVVIPLSSPNENLKARQAREKIVVDVDLTLLWQAVNFRICLAVKQLFFGTLKRHQHRDVLKWEERSAALNLWFNTVILSFHSCYWTLEFQAIGPITRQCQTLIKYNNNPS